MLRTRLIAALRVALLGVIAIAWPISAQQPDPAGELGELPVHGGLPGALQAIGDPTTPDRSHFLLEFIRRTYSGPSLAAKERGSGALPALLTHLERATADRPPETAAGARSRVDTVPLGLPASVWHDVVLGGRSTPHGLLSGILESRNAALLYYAVLSLDHETRAWLARQPELVAEVVSRHAAAFVVAAPAVRVWSGAMRVPGGARAEASWEALAGMRVGEPAAFIRALLTRDGGRLAYFFAAMAPLTERQIEFALRLDAPHARDRVEAARRLQVAFARMVLGWDMQHRPFWRPVLDPALLAGDLRVDDASGAPVLPGTQEFWKLVFAPAAPRESAWSSPILDGGPVEFGWLCEQVFSTDPALSARRYRSVLSASRLGIALTPANVRDSVEAVRAVSDYPALAAVLERGRVHDPAVLARAARRAAQLSSIDNDTRAARAITQYQGALAAVARAGSRRSISPERLAELVSSLSAVDPGAEGEYEGALVRWLHTHLAHTPGAFEADLLRLVAGTAPAEPRLVVWEGTRYRADPAYGETVRISRLLGEDARPYLSSAAELVAIADALDAAELPRATVRRTATRFSAVGQAVGWEPSADWTGDAPERYAAASRALALAAGAGDIGGARRLARPLLALSDDLLARGLLELTYAVALGQPERAWVTAAHVATRHTFGIRPATRRPAWELPAITSGLRPGFGVVGSLLGLDVALADLALVRLSSKPPPRRPMLADVNRKAFIQAATLVEPAWLTDDDLQHVVAAMRKGRERAAALQSPGDANAFAAALRLGPSRSSLLSWIVTHDPERVAAFLSHGELLLSGLVDVPDDSTLHAWGAPALSRTGCLCLRLPRREPGETVAGRWGSGVFVSTFPDLNLRLAELLAEMQMPASLLGPVLASATLDFVNTGISRDEDDRRGLMEFVQALDARRLEQYLALLTTDGPLVPVEDAPDPGPVTQAQP